MRKVFALTGSDTLVGVYPALAAAASADDDQAADVRAPVLPFPPGGEPPTGRAPRRGTRGGQAAGSRREPAAEGALCRQRQDGPPTAEYYVT